MQQEPKVKPVVEPQIRFVPDQIQASFALAEYAQDGGVGTRATVSTDDGRTYYGVLMVETGNVALTVAVVLMVVVPALTFIIRVFAEVSGVLR